MTRFLFILIFPVIVAADEPIDLVANLDDAAASPKTYHAMCAAAYALLAADASGNRPYQAQLDTYAVEHDKKTETALSMFMTSAFQTLLDEGQISAVDLNNLADKCKL